MKQLLVALFTICIMKGFAQSSTIHYVTYGGDSYKAEIVKSFTPGDPNPQLRFKHTQMSTGKQHYEDYIDYVTDGGHRYRAFLLYDGNALKFKHCAWGGNFDKCHNDGIINIRDFSGCNWTVSFRNYSIEELRSQSNNIVLDQTLINCPPPPQPKSTTNGNSGGGTISNGTSVIYTVDKSKTDWVVKFNHYRTIMHHASSGWLPATKIDTHPGYELIIKPGQWMQLFMPDLNLWSLCTDADHR